MRLLFIRHGEPDYDHDTLTKKGWREANLFADMAMKMDLGTMYRSPLGRAMDTASCTMKKTETDASIHDWLREFHAFVDINDSPELQYAFADCHKEGDRYPLHYIVWDMLPGYLAAHPEYMDPVRWRETEVARHGDLVERYDEVEKIFLELLSRHGYHKEKGYFRVEKESEETLTFFCHFGITCVMLAILWDVSPFFLWHYLVMAPSSLTELVTEEREEGIAIFRAKRIGDTSHLALGNEPASFAARFCETYHNFDQRH